MIPERSDILLKKLSDGDSWAVDQIVKAYEMRLRALVRRRISDRLRPKFDSADVVQSVWVHVMHRLRGEGLRIANKIHLEALLVTEARHRLTDRLRHYHSSLDREQPMTERTRPPSTHPRPSEIVQAEQLWEKMLALCPPEHHELLRLKREGFTLDAIAERTGFHEGSVRRILRRLARELGVRGQGSENLLARDE